LAVVRNFSEDMGNRNLSNNQNKRQQEENDLFKNIKRDEKGGIVSRSIVGSSELMH